MIEVYASRLSDVGKETYKVRKAQRITTWLYRHGVSPRTDLNKLAMSLYVNGERLLPRQWAATDIGPNDHVEIYREPKGTDPFSITFALVFGAKAVIAALMPKIPGIDTRQSGPAGEGLSQSSSKGNKVKINDVRPELFGYNPQRYPDYLAPPRSYYAAPREPHTEMILGVGQGSYSIIPSEVRTGETPLDSLGADAEYQIYEPGEDLSDDPAHYFWYAAPEVGSSSTGTAGLELTTGSALPSSVTASVFNFSGNAVTIPSGSGSFPSAWPVGLVVNVLAPYAFTIDNGTGVAGRDVINGPIAQYNFIVGDQIQIAGNNAGFYTVYDVTSTTLQLNYEGGTPGTGLIAGPVVMAMSYRGMRFRILTKAAQTLTVKRLNTDGTDDNAWPGFDVLSSNRGQVLLDSSNLASGYRGPFPACPPNQTITALEVDIFYPSGIAYVNPYTGVYEPLAASQSIEYRDMALGGAWTAVSTLAVDSTLDAQGYTYRVNLPYPMRPEVRVKKIFIPTGGLEKDMNDTMLWQRLKGLMVTSSPTSYAGMTVMTCNIRGGDRISSQSESLVNLGCTRKLPVLRNGVWQPPRATREISAAVGHIIRSVGYSDTDDIDLNELQRLETSRWTPLGDTYDRIVADVDTVKSNLLECLSAGFAELTIDRGLLVPVRDEPRGQAFNSVYNPEVMLEPLSYEFTLPDQPDDFDGVDVEYYDNLTRQDETMPCRLYLPNGQLEPGTRVKKLRLDGVCDAVKAWRWGMRRRRELLYRTRSFSFKTELDALNSAYGDYVALGVTTPGYGRSAEVVGYAPGPPVIIESSEALDWSQPGVYKTVIRRKDGTASGPYVATRVDDYRFSIPSLDFVPDLTGMIDTPPIIQFGHESTWCFPALIQEVTPQGTKTCSVKAVNYDVRVYEDDNNFPPAE